MRSYGLLIFFALPSFVHKKQVFRVFLVKSEVQTFRASYFPHFIQVDPKIASTREKMCHEEAHLFVLLVVYSVLNFSNQFRGSVPKSSSASSLLPKGHRSLTFFYLLLLIAPCRSYIFFHSLVSRAIGITPATTKAAGFDTARYELSILSASARCKAAIRLFSTSISILASFSYASYSRMECVADIRWGRLLLLGPPIIVISLLNATVMSLALSTAIPICSLKPIFESSTMPRDTQWLPSS